MKTLQDLMAQAQTSLNLVHVRCVDGAALTVCADPLVWWNSHARKGPWAHVDAHLDAHIAPGAGWEQYFYANATHMQFFHGIPIELVNLFIGAHGGISDD